MKYMVEVLVNGKPSIATNNTFKTTQEAEEYAKDLCVSWAAVQAYRIYEYGWRAARRTEDTPAWVKVR
jgi:hypothetical protein